MQYDQTQIAARRKEMIERCSIAQKMIDSAGPTVTLASIDLDGFTFNVTTITSCDDLILLLFKRWPDVEQVQIVGGGSMRQMHIRFRED